MTTNTIAKPTRLTRDQMAAILGRGESVGYQGRRLSSIADLPSEADMAAESGDPAAVRETADSIDAQIARLQAERAKLAPAKAAEPEPDDKGKGGPAKK